MKKKIVYPFISAIMLLVMSRLGAQDLSFMISMDKTNYTKDEPVKCTMAIKNTSSKDFVVNNRLLVNFPADRHEVSLVITGPDNRLAFFTSIVWASYNNDKFITLHPGESTSNTYTLTDHFDLMKEGNYSILAYYENKTEAPASLKLPTAWKGTLVSNKTHFGLNR